MVPLKVGKGLIFDKTGILKPEYGTYEDVSNYRCCYFTRCLVANSKHTNFQSKANELWEQGLNQEAASAKIVAKIARFLGSGKSGGLVLGVQQDNFYLFFLGSVYNNIDGQPFGVIMECFGQAYLIDGFSDFEYELKIGKGT